MLAAVGHAYAVNPDKDLRKVAVERGWPILVFTRPVGLRSRVSLPPARQTLAALAVGGALAAGGVLWANSSQASFRRIARTQPTRRDVKPCGGARVGVHMRTQLKSLHVSRVPTRRSTLRRGRVSSGFSRDSS